jgi:hypothetical protein
MADSAASVGSFIFGVFAMSVVASLNYAEPNPQPK